MPELPEVEAVRRVLERTLGGRRVAEVEAVLDDIVYLPPGPAAVAEALSGARIEAVGRKGKTFWLQTDREPVVYGHLGMSGWIRSLQAETEKRLVSHGRAALDDPEGRPRFLKLLVAAEGGGRIAFTDGRRLARIWIGGPPEAEPSLQKLGRDCWTDPWPAAELAEVLKNRKGPIKSLLLNQSLFAGVGNWVADEVLYHAGISPHRTGGSLSAGESRALADALKAVLDLAVEAEADDAKYPEDWLFHVRWGGSRGPQRDDLRRDTIGGRTTAWVPSRQR
ncbi:MAG: hypothetical protein MH204_12550 [Fimbriimonadaceae bacterium]|nr:hypothetical protein [Fimbriimonadaceae bacterium]